jgi:hypothetical protein
VLSTRSAGIAHEFGLVFAVYSLILAAVAVAGSYPHTAEIGIDNGNQFGAHI